MSDCSFTWSLEIRADVLGWDGERCSVVRHTQQFVCACATVIHTKPEGSALLFSPTSHQQLPWKPISQTQSPTPFVLAALITSHNLSYQSYPLSHLLFCPLRHFPFFSVIPCRSDFSRSFTAAPISTSPLINFCFILCVDLCHHLLCL